MGFSDETNSDLLNAYASYKAELWVRRLKIACVITLLSIPSGVVLDKVVYPEFLSEFIAIRAVAWVLIAGVLAMLYSPTLQRHFRVLGLAWITLTVSHIAFMIYASEGIVSPYYIGIVLVIMGSCLLVPWSFRDCLHVCALSLGIYGLSCWAHYMVVGVGNQPNWAGLAINNGFFMLLFTAICLTSSYVAEGIRFREFQLRYDLDLKKKELETSYSKLSELDRAKSQFFANISHELRTPLTLIVSPLDQLRSNPGSKLSPRETEVLDMMFANAMKLLALINDLLDLVKLEAHQVALKVERVDVGGLLAALVGSMQTAAQRAELDLAIEIPQNKSFVIAGDKDKVEKIFTNLIFNAIKFTPAGGKVRVLLNETADGVSVDVQDTGIGIDEDKLAAVFTRFWQADGSPTRARQGTGIGLALVKELVELHKGSVSLRSQKGIGSTFSVTLPRIQETLPEGQAVTEDAWLADLFKKAQHYQERPMPSSPDPVQAPAPESRRRSFLHTLLLVEDDPAMQRFLSSELKETYNVVIASDGYAGYEMAQEHQPKLIVTDMMLPKLDGISLCRKLKASPTLLPAKIVLLTARADDRTKLSALEAGADDFLTKPFSMVELKTRLANLLLTAQLERELHAQNRVLETTLKQLQAAEAQLIQSERLSALGNLSAGIMHEINNPVNFMVTAVHFLRSAIPNASADAIEALNDIDGGLKRVRDIIADLKGFAYGGTSTAMDECEPAKIVRTAKRLIAQEIKHDVQLEETISETATVWGNENQLVQLLVNLLQNALHATTENPDKGKPRQIRIRLEPEGAHFILSVWDNGLGIPKENISKLFDPFFTTRRVGEGMGLGLSISHTIVKQHHGEIYVKSEPGQFTEFTVRLPLTRPGEEVERSYVPSEFVP
jgi:signal transduction histidine kinase